MGMVMSIQDDASLYKVEPWNLPRLSLGIYIYFNTLDVLLQGRSLALEQESPKHPWNVFEHAFQL